MKLSEKDEKELAEPILITIKNESGSIKKEKRIVNKHTEERSKRKEKCMSMKLVGKINNGI